MNNCIKNLLLALAVLLGTSLVLEAQNDKKVIIIKKVIDENGQESEETIILEGAEAEALDIETYLEGEVGEDIDIDINNDGTHTKKEIKVIKKIKEGDDVDIEIDNIEEIEGLENKKIIILKKDGDINIDDIDIEIENAIEDALKDENIFILENSDNIKWHSKTPARPMLGVMLENTTDDSGVYVNKVIDDSPAQKAGIKAGDVITSIADQATNTPEELIAAMKDKEVGQVISITIQREKTPITLEATLSEAPTEAPKMKIYKIDADDHTSHHHHIKIYGHKNKRNCCNKTTDACTEKVNWLGVQISDDEKGTLVEKVEPNSPAAAAGLAEGDIIYKFGAAKITNADDLIEAVRSGEPNKKTKIRYIRAGKESKSKVRLVEKTVTKSCCQKKEEKTIEKEIIILKDEIILEESTELLEEESLVKDFRLFPNPSEGTITLNFSLPSTQSVTISIVDVDGKEIYQEEIADFQGKYNKTIELANAAPGIYFVNVLQGGERFTQKLIINRAK